MKNSLLRATFLVALSVFVVTSSGCGIIKCKLCPQPDDGYGSSNQSATTWQQMSGAEPVTISVTGYGAPDDRIKNRPQQILMALRASEVDAYRTLAERVRGVQISATTKVSDFITDYDHLRAVVDTYIQRARVSSQGVTNQGYYETTLSLTLDQHFFQTFFVEQNPGTASYYRTNDGIGVSTLSTSASHYATHSRQSWARPR
jgi:hypothetical protein